MPVVHPVAVGRLHLITDARPGRNAIEVVRAALRAGADAGMPPTVQVRVKDAVTDREAYQLTIRVVELCRRAAAAGPERPVCLVNDRLHVALAAGADGGHVGADDLPVEAARRVLGAGTVPGVGAVLGATAREPEAAQQAVRAGASYLGVGPAYRSTTKDGLPDPIGPDGVAAVAVAVDVPVVAIGGVTVDRVAPLRAAGAYGVAVIGAINDAADPYAAASGFFAALGVRP